MGNCLKSPTSDDISLLHESQSDRASFGDGADPDLEPPPPYQVSDRHRNFQCFHYRNWGVLKWRKKYFIVTHMDSLHRCPGLATAVV